MPQNAYPECALKSRAIPKRPNHAAAGIIPKTSPKTNAMPCTPAQKQSETMPDLKSSS
jgi:hypothetical protein